MPGEVFECCILQQNRNDQEARRLRKSMITKDFSRIVAICDKNRILQQERWRTARDSWRHQRLIVSMLCGQVVFLQFPVEGRSIDSQGLRRLDHIVGRDLERVEQRLPLDFCQRAHRVRRRGLPP